MEKKIPLIVRVIIMVVSVVVCFVIFWFIPNDISNSSKQVASAEAKREPTYVKTATIFEVDYRKHEIRYRFNNETWNKMPQKRKFEETVEFLKVYCKHAGACRNRNEKDCAIFITP